MLPQKDIDQAEALLEQMRDDREGGLRVLPPAPTRYLVRVRGNALHFHTNACGPMYHVCRDEDATTFATVPEAFARMQKHGIKAGSADIVPL